MPRLQRFKYSLAARNRAGRERQRKGVSGCREKEE